MPLPISEELRTGIARNLEVDRKKALRIIYWLHRLHEQDLVHGEVGMVAFESKTLPIRSLIATVDYKTGAIGCAICGEWAADSGQPLQSGFRSVTLLPQYQSHEIRDLHLFPAVIYCGDCWTKYRADFIRDYDLDPEETAQRENAPITP